MGIVLSAIVIFPFQRSSLLQNPNKNQEPKTKPASEFGFGLFLRFLPYNLLRFNLLPLCFSLRVFALETAKAVPPYQGGADRLYESSSEAKHEGRQW